MMNIQTLASCEKMGNTFPVAAKSATERRNSNTFTGRIDASQSMLVFLCLASAHQNYGGLGETASAGRVLVYGIPTLVQFTTSSVGTSCGDLKTHKEAIMPNQISLTLVAPSVRVENGHAVVSSNELAKAFGKSHRHVLRDIESLECSPEFRESNFGLSKYQSGRGKYKCYNITRDGFAFLAMGFTGKKAAQFKEAYIQAFNQMESQLVGKSEQLPTPVDPIDQLNFIHQRWLVVVEKGVVTNKRVLNHDENIFNRRHFINYFNEPCVGFNQIDELMELSKAVNERLVSLIKLKGEQ